MFSPCESTSGSRSASGDLEGELVPRQCLVMAAGEKEQPGQVNRERREIGIALVVGEHRERALHLLDGLLDVDLHGPR